MYTTVCPVQECGVVEKLDIVDFMEGVESGEIHELKNDIVNGVKNCSLHQEPEESAATLPEEYAHRINGTGALQLAY